MAKTVQSRAKHGNYPPTNDDHLARIFGMGGTVGEDYLQVGDQQVAFAVYSARKGEPLSTPNIVITTTGIALHREAGRLAVMRCTYNRLTKEFAEPLLGYTEVAAIASEVSSEEVSNEILDPVLRIISHALETVAQRKSSANPLLDSDAQAAIREISGQEFNDLTFNHAMQVIAGMQLARQPKQSPAVQP